MEIRELNTEELEALELSLKMISKFTREPRPVSFSGLQRAYDDLISFDKKYDQLEISLGISFGQKFVDTGRYEWVRVSDDYGEETCISPKELMINVAPISMIQKRIEDNLNVDFRELFDETDKVVKDLIESGDYDKR